MTRLLVSLLAFASIASAMMAAPALPTSLVASNYFFTIHSNATSAIWIAPPTWRVMRDTSVPPARGTGIELHAARNEYEPVQVVTRTAEAGTRSLSLGASWTGPSGDVISATLHDVSYGATACATGSPDRLNPIEFGSSQTVCINSNQVFWLTVFVPTNALPGIYSNTLTCVLSGSTTNFPIRVHVFNFTLPAETAFGSFVYWNFSGTPADTLEMKRWFHQHRLTPRNLTYPSSMQSSITWDLSANPSRCASFYDEGDQSADFSIRYLAHQFIAGVGFNGVGFPNFIAQEYGSLGQIRPNTFCSQPIMGDPRGTQYGTAAYNAAWGSYLAALQNYCDPNVPENAGGNPFGHDYLSKAVYSVMNEPQGAADYDLAAWLAQISRQYAPKLRLMISEEAKPEIFNNALYPDQGYDIWVGYLPAYAVSVGNSLIRQRDHGEQSWWYMLPNTPQNFIHPNTTNRPAIETRMLTWLAWNQRVEGWASSPVDPPLATFLGGTSFAPTIRSELLREAMEDYEYFKLANGGRKPTAFQPNTSDPFVSLIASSLTGFDRDPSKLHWLRFQLGRQLSGETIALPLLPVPAPRPYGTNNLNFYNPADPIFSSPIVVDGRPWTTFGWQQYDQTINAGWFTSDTINLLYGLNGSSSSNLLQKSYIYEDFGRQVTFVYGLANGIYDVQVGMGRPTGTSQALVTINGVDVFGNRLANLPQFITNNAVATKRITIANQALVMEVGQQIGGGYNFIDFLSITPVSPSSSDGLDDLWQFTNFGSATNALAEPGADPDNDGASNLLEFHAGTNPTSAASQPFITATLPNANQLQLQWSSATNHVFRIEQSSDLTNWSSAVDSVLATNSITSVAIPRNPADLQSFYRVIPIAP